MGDTLMTRGRVPSFELITPRSHLYIPEIQIADWGTNGLSDADREAIRAGMWFREFAVPLTEEAKLRLIADATWGTPPASLGRFVCAWLDGDRSDLKFSNSIPVIKSPSTWMAKTKLFVDTSLGAGDALTVYEGSSVSGSYGYLEEAATGETCVGRVLSISNGWLTFEAVEPYKLGS